MDQYNHRVQKFNGIGGFITKWGSYGSGDGEFNLPTGVAVDLDNVYVADQFNNRIQKFSSSGTFITKWGSLGTGDGQFDHPEGIAVDSNGNIYVADCGNARIQKFTSSGEFITKWETPAGDVAVDSRGNVYTIDGLNNCFRKFTSTGVFITQYGSYGTGDGQFNGPRGIAVDSDGNVYVSDTENHRIQVFSPVITATVDICPDTLNMWSKGKWITCYIELPEGYDVNDINVSTILLNYTIPAEMHPTEVGDYDDDSIPDLMVKFDRAEVISYIMDHMDWSNPERTKPLIYKVTLTITGILYDGTPFERNVIIRVLKFLKGQPVPI